MTSKIKITIMVTTCFIFCLACLAIQFKTDDVNSKQSLYLLIEKLQSTSAHVCEHTATALGEKGDILE